MITAKLAELLHVRPGDRLELEVRQGERQLLRPVIAGLIDEAAGLQVYALANTVAALQTDAGAVSAVLLRTDPRLQRELVERLKRYHRGSERSDHGRRTH